MKIFKINDFFEKSHICLIVWNSEPEWKGDEYPETYSESNQFSKPFCIIEKDGLTGWCLAMFWKRLWYEYNFV